VIATKSVVIIEVLVQKINSFLTFDPIKINIFRGIDKIKVSQDNNPLVQNITQKISVKLY